MRKLRYLYATFAVTCYSMAAPAFAQSSSERFCVAIVDEGSGLYGVTASGVASSPAQEEAYDKRATKALFAAGATSNFAIRCVKTSRATTVAYYKNARTPYRDVSLDLASPPNIAPKSVCNVTMLCSVAEVFAMRRYPDGKIQCGIEGRRGTSNSMSRAFTMDDARNYTEEVYAWQKRDTSLRYITNDMIKRSNIIRAACLRSAGAARDVNVDGPRIKTP